MRKIGESFQSMLQQLTQIRLLIHTTDMIKKNSDVFDKIEFEGHYRQFPFGKSIVGSLLNYSLLKSASFLEEFNTIFTPSNYPDYRDRIILFKKIVKPVTKRIDQWKDIRNYRNQILAHNFNINNSSFFSEDYENILYNVPHTDAEIKLLSELLVIITNNLVFVFPEIKNLDLNPKMMDKLKFKRTIVDLENEIHAIRENVAKLRSKLTQQ